MHTFSLTQLPPCALQLHLGSFLGVEVVVVVAMGVVVGVGGGVVDVIVEFVELDAMGDVCVVFTEMFVVLFVWALNSFIFNHKRSIKPSSEEIRI